MKWGFFVTTDYSKGIVNVWEFRKHELLFHRPLEAEPLLYLWPFKVFFVF